MKSSVAFLLVLSISSGSVAQAQTTPRRTNQSAVSKPRSDTIRICQGLPIPDGYVIIAYMTSAACPHGAYVLKKQSDYETSLAVNGGARQTADESGRTTPDKPLTSAAQPGPTQLTRKSVSPASVSRGSQSSVAQPTGNAAVSKGSSP